MLAVEKQKAILDYFENLKEYVKQDYLSWGKNSEFAQKNVPQLSLKEGKRFVKIIADKHGQAGVFGFIEKETGLVWKAASWSAPALNFPRGNINDPSGLKCTKWTGVF